MTDFNQKFWDAYLSAFSRRTVYTDSFPAEMKDSEKDNDGWIKWKPIKGTLQESDYQNLESKFSVLFPKSFTHTSLTGSLPRDEPPPRGGPPLSSQERQPVHSWPCAFLLPADHPCT